MALVLKTSKGEAPSRVRIPDPPPAAGAAAPAVTPASVGMITIRRARPHDAGAIWAVLEPTIRAGKTYALDRDLTEAAALRYWRRVGNEVHVAEVDATIVGTYYLRANQAGGGAHVANCGYVTAPQAAGRGVGRRMALHSLDAARRRGFRAMQFNFVVASNDRAVALWRSLGFRVVGRLPGAFAHPTIGLVDALVMFRRL